MSNKNSRARVRLKDRGADLKEAQRFLQLLGGKRSCFQAFDDKADRKDSRVARILFGRLDEHAEELKRVNKNGAGVFVALNETDGNGRKRENIKRVRAVAVDLDGVPLDPVLQCKLRPHVIVESSPGRYHAYWLVRRFPLKLFEDVQRAIAKAFDGDPQIAKLTHVARLPGFLHQKGNPFRSRIIKMNDLPRYSVEDVTQEFPPLAKAHREPISRSHRLVVPSDNPLPAAMQFIDHYYRTTDGMLTLRSFRGSFYRWTGTHYTAVALKEVRAKLYEFLKDAWTVRKDKVEPFKPTRAKVDLIVDALEAGVMESRDNIPPFWMGEPQDNPYSEGFIACRNGILDPKTRKLVPHDPRLFNITCLPFDYDPNAPRPKRWLKFLRQLWPDDVEARRELQKIFGYCLTSDTSHQKIFLIVGPKRGGKGTIQRVATGLVGKDNVAGPTLSSFSKNFGLMALIDKSLAIIADARLGARTDGSVVAERLLSISGEDSLTIDRKYQDPWTGKLGVRFIIFSNELPRVGDASGALTSRYVILTLTKSFYGQEDLTLANRLLRELPSILNWSLDGLDRLHQDGSFKTPQSSQEALRELEDLASPIGAFIREWCTVGFTKRSRVKSLFDAYSKWCDVEGHRAGPNNVFGRDLRAALPQLRTKGRGEQRSYVGIGLSEYGQKRYEALSRLA